MRVLWIDVIGIIPAHRPLIDKLSWAGFRPDIVTVDHRIAGGSRIMWDFYTKSDLRTQCAGYDSIICASHSGNPHLNKLLSDVAKPKSVIDVEHDPFRDAVEICRHELSNCVLAFTTRGEEYIKERGYTGKRAQYSKLEIVTTDISYRYPGNSIDNAVIFTDPGFTDPSWYMCPTTAFRNVWFKDFLYMRLPPNHKQVLGPPFTTSVGSAYLPQIAKFWIMAETSSYLDALLFGCVPILHHANILSETKVDDVISDIRMKKRSSNETFSLKAVTSKNLDAKIALLHKPDVYAATLSNLKTSWFPTDYNTWPKASDVLLDTLLTPVVGAENVGVARMVIKCYRDILNRAPDKPGMLHWIKNSRDEDHLKDILRSSREYQKLSLVPE